MEPPKLTKTEEDILTRVRQVNAKGKTAVLYANPAEFPITNPKDKGRFVERLSKAGLIQWVEGKTERESGWVTPAWFETKATSEDITLRIVRLVVVAGEQHCGDEPMKTCDGLSVRAAGYRCLIFDVPLLVKEGRPFRSRLCILGENLETGNLEEKKSEVSI